MYVGVCVWIALSRGLGFRPLMSEIVLRHIRSQSLRFIIRSWYIAILMACIRVRFICFCFWDLAWRPRRLSCFSVAFLPACFTDTPLPGPWKIQKCLLEIVFSGWEHKGRPPALRTAYNYKKLRNTKANI